MPALLKATGVTMQLTITSVLTAMVLGIFVALARISANKVLSKLAAAYIFVFRGSPLLIQLFIIYFGLPQIIPGFDLGSRFLAAYVAFSLNITAYLAEIFRAAIQSIDKGQMEASRSLGLSYGQAMRLVIIPQSYRRMIPPVCNEFLMVMKDTSLVCIIAVVELTYQTKMIATSSASSLVYIPTLIIYLILTAIFTLIFNRLEKKFSVYE
jgi:polar amino acid transport system permease protein